MTSILITEIAYAPDMDSLSQALRIRNQDDVRALERLSAEAQALARPKAAYRPAYVAQQGEDNVTIDDVTLSSRVLRVNLGKARRVFLYLATCGTELDAWAHSLDDMLHRYWAEELKVQALRAATDALYVRIQKDYQPGQTTIMNPGSLADWPLSQQRPFFQLMSDAAAQIDITLSDSCLMTPNKSVSGIRFPTETGFESCQLCPMPDCPGRRAPYDAELYAHRFAPVGDERAGRADS
jgi:hypothetical protein